MTTFSKDQILRVVLVSPSDVAKERTLVKNIVEDLNIHCGKFFRIRLELSRWEDIPPAFHEGGPQGLIDELLEIETSDLVIGILSKRLGTLMSSGETGTEHEIRAAYKRWSSHARPRVMLYFNDGGMDSATPQDLEEMLRVARFRLEFQPKGVVSLYRGVEDFGTKVRNHLTSIISETAAARVTPESIQSALSVLPRDVRGEGAAELVGELRVILPRRPNLGDIVANIEVSLNTNVTTTIDHQGMTLEALLIVEDGINEISGPKATRGRVLGVSSLSFESVKLPLRGAAGVITLRILGIRANALLLTRSNSRADIFAFVKIEVLSGPSIAILNPQVTVGLSSPGFAFSAGMATFDRTEGANAEFALGLKPSLQINLVCTFHQNFPGAFRSRIRESVGGAYQGSVPRVPLASSGTLLGIHFSGIPEGVTVYVTVFDTIHGNGIPMAELRSLKPNAEQAEGPAGKMVALSRIGNSADAVWEWISDLPDSTLHASPVSFGVAIVARPGEAALGASSVRGSLMPLSTAPTANRTTPVPRFGDLASEQTAFSFQDKLERGNL